MFLFPVFRTKLAGAVGVGTKTLDVHLVDHAAIGLKHRWLFSDWCAWQATACNVMELTDF